MKRRGLVLGAGGVLGAAWSIGALRAIEEHTGWDPRTAEVIIGTSAGSVLAALLSSGVGSATLVNHQRGVVVPGDPRVDFDYDSSPLPPRPRLRVGSTALLRQAALHPWSLTPLAALSSLAPVGRGSLGGVAELVDAVVPHGEWAPHPNTWIVAMDYESGRRVPFGREGAPPASLVEAVSASCAIPGWYAPVEIGGRRYVDGGVCSVTSVDLLATMELDEVFVLSPMTSVEFDRPLSRIARLERRFRRQVTRRLLREASRVRDAGSHVVLMMPGPEDLEVIGVNLMDARRREAVLEMSLRTSAETLERYEAQYAETG